MVCRTYVSKSLILLMRNVTQFGSLLKVTVLGIGLKYRAIVGAPLPVTKQIVVIFNVLQLILSHIKGLNCIWAAPILWRQWVGVLPRSIELSYSYN